MTSLPEKVVVIHRSLDVAGLPHAFGGALALGWCTQRPRATSDIDLNVFVSTSEVRRVIDALPADIEHDRRALKRLEGEGQARLLWETTPIDLFLNVSPFHETAMKRVSVEPFDGEAVPFLACEDLAVFKAFLDRRRDWADLEDMLAAKSIDVDRVAVVLAEHLGREDERIAKLRELEHETER